MGRNSMSELMNKVNTKFSGILDGNFHRLTDWDNEMSSYMTLMHEDRTTF